MSFDPLGPEKEMLARHEREVYQQIHQKMQRYSEMETMIQHRAAAASKAFIRKHSPATFYLFFYPTLFCCLSLGACITGNFFRSNFVPKLELVFYVLQAIFCALMIRVLIKGIRMSSGFLYKLALVHTVIACGFVAYLYFRFLTVEPPQPAVDLGNNLPAQWIIGLMLCFGLVTFLTDLFSSLRRGRLQQRME